LQVLLAKEELRQTVLKVMADNKVDALVYATFDHQVTVIAPDVMTNRLCGAPHNRFNAELIVMRRGVSWEPTITQLFQ